MRKIEGEKMKNIKRIHKEYAIMKNISIIFTEMLFMAECIILYNEKMGVPDIIEFISAVLLYCLPILSPLCWYMCGERYMQIQLEGKEGDERKVIRKSTLSVIVKNVYWGVGFYVCLWANAFFLIQYSEALNKLYYYYGVVFAVTVFWLFGLLFRHKIVRCNKLLYFVISVISVILFLFAIERANAFVFIQRMNM